MNPYHKIGQNHDHYAHMSQIEQRHRPEFQNRPTPLDDLISSATLKVVNAIERGWRRMTRVL